MKRRSLYLSIVCLLATCESALAQAPGIIYTWNGTGDVRGWVETTGFGVISNTTAGQLTLVEGDPLDPGSNTGPHVVIRDSYQRRLESSVANGGLDVTGLSYLEFDIAHNSPTGTINVQFFAKRRRTIPI